MKISCNFISFKLPFENRKNIISIFDINSNLHILCAANTTKNPATTEQSDMGWAEEKMTSGNKIEEAQQRIKG